MSDFVPRDWQSKACHKVYVMADAGADRTLVFGCPGSGKTILGLLVGKELIRRLGKTQHIVVITPNLAIKSQWIDRAKEMGIDLMPVRGPRDLQQELLPGGVKGFIMNYQQAINIKHSLKGFCEDYHPVAILDEVHHTAGSTTDRDGNAWGHAVERALEKASFKLAMTGTPFREGNNPIAFVRYDDDGRAIPGISYSYEDAIRDGVCRALEFRFYDGYVDWSSKDGQRVRANFETQLSKRLSRERIRAALSTKGEFPSVMLAAAHAHLLELRRGSGVDARAGGLVVAIDIAHAQQIAEVLTEITGQAPVLVHSNIDDAQDQISDFRQGDAPWIIGISMLSEGVDIPRLRVGVYCSRNRTALYFHQFCGRFIRVQEDPNERAYVFLPRDPEIEAIAIEIEKERYHAVGEEPPRRRRTGGERPTGEVAIDVEASDGSEVGTVVRGLFIPREYENTFHAELDRFKRALPKAARSSNAELLRAMVELDWIPAPTQRA